MAGKTFTVVAAFAAVLAIDACSTKPAATETKAVETKPEAPPEPVAAKSAFYLMYKPARAWAPDVMPLSLTGNDVEGIESGNGKYPMWTAVFVSAARQEARTFFYAVANHAPDVHKGVSIGGAEPWGGATTKSRPFPISEFNINSDGAYKAGAEKAADWLTKHPEKKLAGMILGSTSHFAGPVWYLLWGDHKSGYEIFIDATTGLPGN